jgi:hypothetical protein
MQAAWDGNAMTDTNAPERIWAFTYDNCDFDNEDEYRLNVPSWQEKKPIYDATEYVRADRFAALDAQIATLTAERDAARAVRVKPLEWDEDLKGRWIGKPEIDLGHMAFWVFLLDGQYKRATKDKWNFYATLEAAKAAAQQDYEARILAALEKPE